MSKLWQYIVNLLHLADQAVNCIVFLGDPRMTLSARMGRDIAAGRCAVCGYVCKVLNLFQANHCAKAWASEQPPMDAGMQLPPD